MTLVSHQGEVRAGVGSIDLNCGGGRRYLKITFEHADEGPSPKFPGSTDGRYGRGTSMMRIQLSTDFFLFVTGGSERREVIGESRVVTLSVRVTILISIYRIV
jgi:hypothetical protein